MTGKPESVFATTITIGAARALALLLLAVPVSAPSAQAQAQTQPADRPVLRIQSVFAAPLWRADIDESERHAVVSNADKALLIWSLDDPDAAGARIARAPIRNEQRRIAHGAAISPNAELTAYSVPPEIDAAGRLKPHSARIYIQRRGSGRIVQVLGGRESDVATRPLALRFSPDGQWLAASLSGGCGVRVWSTRTWKIVHRDDVGFDPTQPSLDRCCRSGDPLDCDRRGETTGVLFPKPGVGRPWLITSGDTGLHAYDRRGEAITRRKPASNKAIGLERPGGIAPSPDGRHLVVGERRNRESCPIRLGLAVIDAVTLAPAGPQPRIRDSAMQSPAYLSCERGASDVKQSTLDRVAWVKSGAKEYVFGAGVVPCYILNQRPEAAKSEFDMCMARWAADRFDAEPDFLWVGGTDRVKDIIALNRRRGVLLATERAIGVYDFDGGVMADQQTANPQLHSNVAIDYRGGRLAFRISPDGRVVAAETYGSTAQSPVSITLDLNAPPIGSPRVTAGTGPSRADIEPDQDPDGNIVRDWKDRSEPPVVRDHKLAGHEFAKDEVYRAVALLRDKDLLVLGSSQFIRIVSYEDSIPAVLCQEPIRDDAYRVNITPDGRTVVAGHGDGTLRWYRTNLDGRKCRLELLATVYLAQTKSGEWAVTAWRPNGEFDRNSEARIHDLVGWQVSTADGQVRLIPFSEVPPKLHRGRDFGKHALESSAYANPGGQGPKLNELDGRRGTQAIYLESSPPTDNITTPRVAIRIAISDAGGWPKRLRVDLGDGLPVELVYQGRTYAPFEPLVVEKEMLSDGMITLDIDLPAGARSVKGEKQLCFQVNNKRDSCHRIRWTGPVVPASKRRLWAVLVGMSGHTATALNLRFAENDVIDLARMFVGDFEREAAAAAVPPKPPQYAEVQLNLVVSSATEAAENEVKDLAKRSYVRLFLPTKAGIIAALDDLRNRATDAQAKEPGDDLFFFLFSGHGGVNPFPDAGNEGLTVFATRDTVLSPSAQNLRDTALTSTELLDLIDRIPGQKVIVLDACRTLPAVSFAAPFDSRLAAEEFERRVLSAHFFQSSRWGQPSRESQHLVFDSSRPEERRGNSAFTYAILTALSDARAAHPDSVASRPLIEIRRVDDLIRLELLNADKAGSPIRKAADAEQWDVVPEPYYTGARQQFPTSVLRVLEKAR